MRGLWLPPWSVFARAGLFGGLVVVIAGTLLHSPGMAVTLMLAGVDDWDQAQAQGVSSLLHASSGRESVLYLQASELLMHSIAEL